MTDKLYLSLGWKLVAVHSLVNITCNSIWYKLRENRPKERHSSWWHSRFPKAAERKGIKH